MDFGKLDIVGGKAGHIIGFLSRSFGCFKGSYIGSSMQAIPAALADSGNIDRIIGKFFRYILGHQKQTGCAVADGTTVEKVHGPGNRRVHRGIPQKILLVSPVRQGFPFLTELFDSRVHEITDRQRNLGFGITVLEQPQFG